MRPLFFLLLTIFAGVFTLQAQGQRPTQIDVDVATATATIPVRVTAAPADLNQLANLAFETHGRFRRVTTGQAYDIRFSVVADSQVRVEVLRGSNPVLNQVASGSSTRNALLRAADLAVKQTSGLNGFFASRLAFISERTGQTEVYTGDLFFGEVRQLTSDRRQAMMPRWAPDGSRLLYTGYFRTGFADIFMIDLNTLQRTTFVSFKGTNSSARFSPDGQRVAMVLSGEGNPEVYVSNAQGRQVSRRTRTSAVEASPGFSPDGSQLLFTSDAAGGPQLYTMPAEGGTMQRLPTNISGYCAEPDWSRADPNKIAFTMRIGSGFQIAVFDRAARGPAKQVSKAPRDAVEPAWLNDGRHLIYTARAANSRSLWILDTESGKATRISTNEMGACSQASAFYR